MKPEEQSADEPTAPATTDRRPLYLRLYYQAHLTELVQAIGYGELPLDQARDFFKPLIDRYGEPLIRVAGNEVLTVDHSRQPPIVRLSDDARRLATMLLGKPPANPPLLSAKPPTKEAVGEGNHSENTELPPVKAKRSVVAKEFASWLAVHDEDYTIVDAAERSRRPDANLRLVDFIVRKAERQLLLAVRRSLKPAERISLLDAECACGEGTTAVRVWPDEGPHGWVWRKHALFRDKRAPEADAPPAE